MPSPPIEALIASWELSLRARNLSSNTIDLYLSSARHLAVHVDPPDVDGFTRDAIRDWLTSILNSRSPSTADTRYRNVQQWFKWLVAEGEIDDNPMVGVAKPVVPDTPVPVIAVPDLRRLLDVCDGKSFEDRRDAALLRLFFDAGVRLEEMSGMTVAGLDLRDQVVVVFGKFRRERTVSFGAKAAAALDRYLRLRARRPDAGAAELWLGARGPLTKSGVYRIVKRRARQAGFDIHPHQLRHTAAHMWLAEGGNEGDLMKVMGWRSRRMVDRYGASAAEQRARAAHKRLGLGDKV